ncbi:MAG: RagB/SusD family nutrient uptake outer membrane protein [Chitinophagaceae bacterium]
MIGEAKFLRAWAYYELVSQWGDVPMYTEPVNSSISFKGKEPAANIYTLILSDLTDAAAKLPASSTAEPILRPRATKELMRWREGLICRKAIIMQPKQRCWLLLIPAFTR